jgi:hypothetical protein
MPLVYCPVLLSNEFVDIFCNHYLQLLPVIIFIIIIIISLIMIIIIIIITFLLDDSQHLSGVILILN